MKCQEAQHWICCHRLFADGLGEKEAAALAEHLLSCAACTEAMDEEEAFDARIQPAMLAVAIPSGLPQRIVWEMRRARRARQRFLTLCGSLAAAAVLLLAICGYWYTQRPYDLARLQDAAYLMDRARVIAKFEPPVVGREKALVEWLQRQGIAAFKPAQLKLQNLTSGYLLEIGGRKIAMLEMNSPVSSSRVYLLQRRYFNEKQRMDLELEGVASKLIADSDESTFLGWMVIDKGSALDFLEDELPNNGT